MKRASSKAKQTQVNPEKLFIFLDNRLKCDCIGCVM